MDSIETRPPHRKPGGPVPLTRVKTLVSMTTPRDFRATHGTATLPPFVEFDMSAEGFGCLYLPSVAPQSPTGPSVVAVGSIGVADTNVVGGIGSGKQTSHATHILLNRPYRKGKCRIMDKTKVEINVDNLLKK